MEEEPPWTTDAWRGGCSIRSVPSSAARSKSIPMLQRSDTARCLHGSIVHPGEADPIRSRLRACAARSDACSDPTRPPPAGAIFGDLGRRWIWTYSCLPGHIPSTYQITRKNPACHRHPPPHGPQMNPTGSQESPTMLRDGPKYPEESDTRPTSGAQDSRRHFRDVLCKAQEAPRRPHSAPTGPNMGSRLSRMPPQRPPTRPQQAKNLNFPFIFERFCASRLFWPRTAQ